MSRPLIQRRIDELESMFKTNLLDVAALRLLEAELSLRSMPRAVTLLGKVRQALYPESPQLLPGRSNPVEQLAPTAANEHQSIISAPNMTEDEALRILKVTKTATWEEIELSRRTIIERTRPDKLESLSQERRASTQEEGRQANSAYLLLLQMRRT